MRKALCVAVLVVLAWTGVAAAQETPTVRFMDLANVEGTRSLLSYLQFKGAYGERTVISYTGRDWADWSQALKVMWVSGFMAGINLLGMYGSFQLALAGQPFEWLEDASRLQYRVGVYVLELDSLYEDYENADIYLVDAMFIARERLNGRSVNIEEWRKKGQQKL